MYNENQTKESNWLDSIKEKCSTIYSELYLKYKGEEYRRKLEASERAFKDLFEILSQDPEATKHLEEISKFLDLIIKENNKLTVKDMLNLILRIVGYVV